MGQLEGKIVLVTGGASGIGRAAAERVAEEGGHAIVADIDVPGGKAVADEVSGEFVELDVSDAARWREVVEGISSAHGGLDVAFLNAGVSTRPAPRDAVPDDPERPLLPAYTIEGLEDDDYRRVMAANVDGVVFGMRAAVPALQARGGGQIVATASVAGLVAFGGDPIYTMTKHAVVGLVRGLAVRLAEQGIRIHALCPGIVNTAILGPHGADIVRARGIPVMPPSQIADTLMHALRADEPGGLWVCLPDTPPRRYDFAPLY